MSEGRNPNHAVREGGLHRLSALRIALRTLHVDLPSLHYTWLAIIEAIEVIAAIIIVAIATA